MPLPVEESESIFCDVQEIVRYLHRRNAAAAQRFLAAFRSTVAQLAGSPHLGRLRADLGAEDLRSWQLQGFRNYLVFYEVRSDCLRLWRVLHGARDLSREIEG